MNIKQAGELIGLLALITFAGAPLLGWLGDVFLKITAKGRLLATAVGATLFLITMTISLQYSLWAKTYYVVMVSWGLAMFFQTGITSTLVAVTQDLSTPLCRAMTVCFIPIANNWLGGVQGPVIAGAISDKYGVTIALQVILILGMGLLLLFSFLASRFYDRDMARVKELGTFELEEEAAIPGRL